MPQPNSDPAIVSPPAVPGQPYSAATTATAPWATLPDSGPCNAAGTVTGTWEDSPPFTQIAGH
jgi:hypothetical protein